MIKVYILEDDIVQLNFIRQQINNAIMIEALDAAIEMATQSPSEIVAHLQEIGADNSLFFLDIEIESSTVSGLDLARLIRAQTSTSDIIFITSHEEAALQILTDQIMPMDLISKGENQTLIAQRIQADMIHAVKLAEDRKYHSPKMFNYPVGAHIRSLPLDTVCWVQTMPDSPGTLTLSADNQEATFHGNLTLIEKAHPQLFRCHKSALINPAKIRDLDSHQRFVVMADDARIEVSFRRLAPLRKLLSNDTPGG